MENNSKQAVLSIVGIAILVIAVVGVSFAFFTYTRNGTTNNLIETGSISFTYTEAENGIVLTNAFPTSDAEGYANTNSAEIFTFHVTSNISSTSKAINYTVTAVDGGTTGVDANHTNRLLDNQVDLYLTAELSKNAANSSVAIDGGYDTANSTTGVYGAACGNSTNGFQVAHGTVGAGETNYDASFTMKMWVNDSVTISDTDYSKTYRASATSVGDSPLPYDANASTEQAAMNLPSGKSTDDRKVYNTLYYSLKINVEANDTNG